MSIFTKKEVKNQDEYVPWMTQTMRVHERLKSLNFVIFIQAILIILFAYGFLTNPTEVKTVVVEVDATGYPVNSYVADAQQLPAITEKEIQRTLIQFTKTWRFRSTDRRSEIRKYRNLSTIVSNAAATKFKLLVEGGNLHPWISLKEGEIFNYLEGLGDFTADAKFVSISRIGDQTYQVRFKERAYTSNGTVMDEYIVVVNYTVGQFKPESVNDAMLNPFGIYIIDIAGTTEKEGER